MNLLINLLFKLIGFKHEKINSIGYLFGATTINHESRQKKWNRALARLWKDKEMLDYLYYQAEADKENAWRGNTDKRLIQGARMRTLYVVYQAHKAYLEESKSKTPDSKDFKLKEKKEVESIYKKLTNIKS